MSIEYVLFGRTSKLCTWCSSVIFELGVRAWCSSVIFGRGVRAWCSSARLKIITLSLVNSTMKYISSYYITDILKHKQIRTSLKLRRELDFDVIMIEDSREDDNEESSKPIEKQPCRNVHAMTELSIFSRRRVSSAGNDGVTTIQTYCRG